MEDWLVYRQGAATERCVDDVLACMLAVAKHYTSNVCSKSALADFAQVVLQSREPLGVDELVKLTDMHVEKRTYFACKEYIIIYIQEYKFA